MVKKNWLEIVKGVAIMLSIVFAVLSFLVAYGYNGGKNETYANEMSNRVIKLEKCEENIKDELTNKNILDTRTDTKTSSDISYIKETVLELKTGQKEVIRLLNEHINKDKVTVNSSHNIASE